jgi:bacterioferritin-associated ferredoxin
MLFAGPTSNICDVCVETLAEILSDDRMRDSATADVDKALPAASPMLTVAECSLCRRRVIVEELVAVVGRGAVCSPCIVAVRAIRMGSEDSGNSED